MPRKPKRKRGRPPKSKPFTPAERKIVVDKHKMGENYENIAAFCKKNFRKPLSVRSLHRWCEYDQKHIQVLEPHRPRLVDSEKCRKMKEERRL